MWGGVDDVPRNGKESTVTGGGVVSVKQGLLHCILKEFRFLITASSSQSFQTTNDSKLPKKQSVYAPIGEALCVCVFFSLVGKCMAYLSHFQHTTISNFQFLLISCA